MNIICITENDWAGVQNGLKTAVEKHSNHTFRVINQRPHKYGYPHDLIEREEDWTEYERYLFKADLVLFGASQYWYKPFSIPIPDDVPWAIWHGGSDYRKQPEHYIEDIHPLMDVIYAHRDLLGLCHRAYLLHQPYDTRNYRPIERSDTPFYVGHSPSVENRKRTEFYIEAMTRLRYDHPNLNIEPLLMMNMSAEEVLHLKEKCHMFFDQIYNPKTVLIPEGANMGYGLSLVESAAVGSVCMAGCDYPDTPILHVNTPEDIMREVMWLYNNRDVWQRLSTETYEWVNREHSYENIAEQFLTPLELEGIL